MLAHDHEAWGRRLGQRVVEVLTEHHVELPMAAVIEIKFKDVVQGEVRYEPGSGWVWDAV